MPTDVKLPEAWRPFAERSEDPPGRAPRSLAAKLAEVMAAVERVPKHGRNDFHKYDYATEADIAAAIRKELAARSVILIPSIVDEKREPVGEKGSVLTTLIMQMEFIDGDTRESIIKSWRGYGTDKEDKGGYKAMTGAEKYFLLKSFLMPTGDDPERDDPKQRAAREKQTVRAPETPPEPARPAEASIARPKAGTRPTVIPDGWAWLLEVQAGQWGKAKGQIIMVDGTGTEGTFAAFSEQLVALAQQCCTAGELVRPEFATPQKGGKTYLKALYRQEQPF